jgi:hypothetical protein
MQRAFEGYKAFSPETLEAAQDKISKLLKPDITDAELDYIS